MDLKPAQRARKAHTTPGSLHAQTASVVIRVWTLCIIRSVPEQRQTDLAVLAPFFLISLMRPSWWLSAVSVVWKTKRRSGHCLGHGSLPLDSFGNHGLRWS